jgi:hypothetical protein
MHPLLYKNRQKEQTGNSKNEQGLKAGFQMNRQHKLHNIIIKG